MCINVAAPKIERQIEMEGFGSRVKDGGYTDIADWKVVVIEEI